MPQNQQQEQPKQSFTPEQPKKEGGGEAAEDEPGAPTESETKETNESKETKTQQEEIQKTKSGIQQQKQTKQTQQTQTQQKDDLTQEIESILEKGLEDAYQEMTPVQQQEFKIKGEETAKKIRDLIQAGKAKVKKIFELIFEWLKALPGVNKFYIEQEAKIKADKVAKLEQQKKEEKQQEQKDINIKEE